MRGCRLLCETEQVDLDHKGYGWVSTLLPELSLMSQPQRHTRRPPPVVHPGNPAERQAQADRVMIREVKQHERRRIALPGRFRRRKGDR